MTTSETGAISTRVGVIIISRLEPTTIERLRALIRSLGRPERTWFYPVAVENETLVVYGALIRTEERFDEVASKIDEFTRANSARAIVFSPWEFVMETEL